jgi:hypothetical protein
MPLCHVVTFTFKTETPTEWIGEFGAALDGLGARTSAVTYHHGRDVKIRSGNADYSVTAIFKDEAEFTSYITSPEHLRIVSEMLTPHLESRSAVQFSIDWLPQPGGEHADDIRWERTIWQSGAKITLGAAGGVGPAAVQIAKDRGIRVIGTAGPDNYDYLASLGATATTYGLGLTDWVRELAPWGIDETLEVTGFGVIPDLIELTGDPAKVVPIADFNAPDYGAQVSVSLPPGDYAAAFTNAARMAERGRLSIPVQQTYTLEQAADAQIASPAGHVTGRFIMTVL